MGIQSYTNEFTIVFEVQMNSPGSLGYKWIHQGLWGTNEFTSVWSTNEFTSVFEVQMNSPGSLGVQMNSPGSLRYKWIHQGLWGTNEFTRVFGGTNEFTRVFEVQMNSPGSLGVQMNSPGSLRYKWIHQGLWGTKLEGLKLNINCNRETLKENIVLRSTSRNVIIDGINIHIQTFTNCNRMCCTQHYFFLRLSIG